MMDLEEKLADLVTLHFIFGEKGCEWKRIYEFSTKHFDMISDKKKLDKITQELKVENPYIDGDTALYFYLEQGFNRNRGQFERERDAIEERIKNVMVRKKK